MLAGVVPIAVAFVLIKQHGLFDTILATFGITGGPMAMPLLAGLVYRRGTSRGAVASLIAGMAVGAALAFGADAPYNNYQWYSLGSIATTLFVFPAVSWLTQPGVAKQQMVADFFNRLSQPIDPPSSQATDGPSPFGIVGLVTLGLGVSLFAIGLVNTWHSLDYPSVSEKFEINIHCSLVLGHIRDDETDTALFIAHDMCFTPDGRLFIGETDTADRAGYLWECSLAIG